MFDIKKLMPVILITVIFVIGLPFVAVIMGSVDSGVDLAGTDYAEQYNSTTDTSVSSIGMLQIVPYLLVVVILIMAIGAIGMRKSRGGY